MGKPYHHGDLRAALIEAGLALIGREGLEALSLRRLAAEVGVSHTAPKNHFATVRGLLTAIAAEGFRRLATALRRAVDGAEGREMRLRAGAQAYVGFALDHPQLFQLMFSPLHSDPADPDLRKAGSDSYAVLADVAPAFGAPSDAPYAAELALWSLLHGYATLLLGDKLRTDEAGAPLLDVVELLPIRPA